MTISPARLACFALAWLAVAATPLQAAEHEQARLKREAVGLVSDILKNSSLKAERCSFSEAWLAYPVSGEVAGKYLGLPLRANLMPPDHATTLAQILEAAGAPRQLVCGQAARQADTHERLRTLKGAGARDGRQPAKPGEPVRRKQIELTFPIFDASYRRAIVVATYSAPSWIVRPDGTIFANAVEELGRVQVYRKHGKAWRLIAAEEIFSSELAGQVVKSPAE